MLHTLSSRQMPITNKYPRLTVYKASAGSGKTYTLALRYIQLLVNQPDAYRHILAVTFTNKATEEMKMRILKELYALAHDHPSSQKLRDTIVENLGITREQVQTNTAAALSLLLHNYTAFNVQTIDSFFQKVLRNLAREMGLNAMPRVELKDVSVEEQAVDLLFRSLTDNDERMKWITDFIRSRMSDDKGWNVVKDIKKFGTQLFKDDYKLHRHAINKAIHQEGFFENYKRELEQLMNSYVNTLQSYGRQFLREVEQLGLSVDDFSQKDKGVAGFFQKLAKGDNLEELTNYARAKECAANPDKWAPIKSALHSTIAAQASASWMQLATNAIETLEEGRPVIGTVKYTLKNMHQLRLLQSIDEMVDERCRELNCFLLSNTQALLHDLLYNADGRSTDAPFIFEKIGTHLRHIMIDEFQDTGRLQWMNFRILLEECMAHAGSQNIIVGDVKQSIYRWRAGDWRLLQYLKQNISSPQPDIIEDPLNFNWRSFSRIINFNNAFFSLAREKEQENVNKALDLTGKNELSDAYAGIRQQHTHQTKEGGYVSIQLLNKEHYKERTLDMLTTEIRHLIDNGVPATHIAILCRRNSELALVAAHLSQQLPDVPLIARDAFRLNTSIAVLTIVEAMRLLQQPCNMPTLALLVMTYRQHVLHQPCREAFINADLHQRRQLLPKDYIEKEDVMRGMPLYDLAEYIYTTFQLHRLTEESAYVCAFFDMLQNYVSTNTADINAFLTAWDDYLCLEKVSTAQHNGIQFLTIHTSKGLEFPYVFMPFTDWRESNSNQEILWCEPQTEPFNQLPVIPLTLTAKLKNSIYANDYKEEELQHCIDRLNLLYVGFTRARTALYVSGRSDEKLSRSSLIKEVLDAWQQTDSTAAEQADVEKTLAGDYSITENTAGDQQCLSFEYGTRPFTEDNKDTDCHTPSDTDKESSYNPFNAQSEELSLTITPQQANVSFRQSNDSLRFVGHDTIDPQQQHYIERGKVLHYVFSRIRTLDDTDTILRELQAEGVLNREGLSYDATGKMIRSALKNSTVAAWFAPHQHIINERTITTRDPKSGRIHHIRPDRVMVDGHNATVVDFKFGKEDSDHRDQVHRYMECLQEMGYTHVEGYLWYVYQNHVIPVNT